MASTGVLPFVRGIDLSRNDLQEERFPKAVSTMTGLKWLKLNETSIDWIPEELGNLTQLESLSFVRNNLRTLHGEIAAMTSLRYLNCRCNSLNNGGIPTEVFKLEALLVLDLSRNQLKQVPPELEKTKSLLVLNLSHNSIESVPNQLFINLSELIYLDLSNNSLETLPPQLRRLASLQTLILNNNPLGQNQLRQLTALTMLQTMHLRNTQRNLHNMPPSLDALTHLTDVDMGQNELQKMPKIIYTLSNLKRLNLSDNSISELSNEIGDYWKCLEVLNLSKNKLQSLPNSLCKLIKLRRLYLSDNLLDFDGIPSGIGKLCNLEVFVASYNKLEMIPEGVVRCGRLKRLILSHNRLITLPDAIHLLNDIETLDLSDNPDLIMPPKPTEYQYISKGSGIEFYNIDFSLNTQLRLAGAPTLPNAAPSHPAHKDPMARKKRLRMRQHKEGGDEADTNQAKVLKGMSELAKEKNKNLLEQDPNFIEANLKPKRWDEALEKPPLDYSDFFEEDVGQLPGLTIWEIENFLPNHVDEAVHGKFYEGDCYIILQTTLDEKESLDWKIYYWIGAHATLDKKACSAIHAVNLRNYLGAQCRTIREEQGEESEEMIALFPEGMVYIEGGRTASGFFTVEEAEVTHRMYRLHELPNKQRQLYLETVPLSHESLDPRFVFVIDAGVKIFVWNGAKAKNTMKQKARLLAEKINKEERKYRAETIFCLQGDETNDFLSELNISESDDLPQLKEHVVVEEFKPFKPILYQVGLGMGYLELPQVEYKEGKLTSTLMETKNVYILDCSGDVFVWLGRKSARLVKAAALKLSQEVFSMIKRCPYALVTRCLEGNEPQVFKTKFVGWDDVIAVDFTRTADSVARTGADLRKWMSSQEVKVDLSALFMPRQPSMTREEAKQLMDEWNEDLEAMEAFVLEGKKFVKLPEEELGHFHSEDCYVFLCRYWVPVESDEADGDEEEVEDDFQCIVYFWQGRDAGNMGWLTFTFSLQKKFKSLFGDKLEVLRTHQQQENLKFLSHFKQKFVIHHGKRKRNPVTDVEPEDTESDKQVELYQLRSNSSPITTRCIQLPVDASLLNSGFCFLLKVPSDDSCLIYVWIGSNASEEEAKLTEAVAVEMFPSEARVSIINEKEEPPAFWEGLGGKKDYEEDSSFMRSTRLFRCSNDKGYFSISEKCSDFCQDDLADDDIMILDNGTQVFIWVGSRCSDVEIKLAYKSAQVYVQNMRIKQPDRGRQLMLTFKGKESKKFKKCFHGWNKHKQVNDPRNSVKLICD